MRKHLGSVATLGVAVLVSGCGGGGQSSAPAVPPTGLIKTAPAHGTAKARLTIKIPLRKASATNSSRRTPRYVSTETKELAIRAAASADIGTAPWQLFDVSANASGCTPAGNFQTCTVSINAPLPAVPGAEDEVQIIATDGTRQPGDTLPNGDYLSTGDTSVAVTVGAVNPVNALLTGVIGTLEIIPPSRTAYSVWAAPGSSSTVMVPITPFDFAGGEIAGSAYSFNNPITFSDGLGAASPFTYQSANPPANYGLPPSLTLGVPISAPVVYTAPLTLTAPSTTTVTVSTVVPNYLPSPAPPKVWPATTFTLSPMVVSVAGMPVASIPNLVVGGSDVTVTVNEDKASVSKVVDNTGGAVALGPIVATVGATTFTVHAVNATSDPTSTIVVTDANGTAATLPVMVAATATPTPTSTPTLTPTPTATPTPTPTSTPTVAPTIPPIATVTITSSSVLRQVTKRH